MKRRRQAAAAVEADDRERHQHFPAVDVVAVGGRRILVDGLRLGREVEAADHALRLLDHVGVEELAGDEEGRLLVEGPDPRRSVEGDQPGPDVVVAKTRQERRERRLARAVILVRNVLRTVRRTSRTGCRSRTPARCARRPRSTRRSSWPRRRSCGCRACSTRPAGSRG